MRRGNPSTVTIGIKPKGYRVREEMKPTGLRVTPDDRKLTLRRQAPAPARAGDSVFVYGYEVGYRCGGRWIDHGEKLARSDGRFDGPLSRQTTRVIDGLVSGYAHEVRVRAPVFLFRADGGTTHSLLSNWVCGTGTPSGGSPAERSYCDETTGTSGQSAGTSGQQGGGTQGSAQGPVSGQQVQGVSGRADPPPALHATLIGQMSGCRNDPQWVSFKEHTDRWDRALLAFGGPVSDTSLTPITAAEAQGYADRGRTRWVGVAAAPNTVVTGTGSADTLTGTSSGELPVGLGGADTLSGHGDDDELRGGSGDDDLSGGEGRDRFVFFDVDTGAKAITDFAAGDVIVLVGSGWRSVRDILDTANGASNGVGYVYTLASGLTVETTNTSLKEKDFVTD